MRSRHEIGSVGFDDFVQLVGGDQFGTANATGLRIPAIVSPSRYVFMCAGAYLNRGDHVVGMRPLLTIANIEGTGEIAPGPPFQAFEFDVTSPGWRYMDGFVTWLLYVRSGQTARYRVGPVDSQSFRFQDAISPALLYQTAVGLPSPAGYLGLTGYGAPMLRGTPRMVWRDVRHHWADDEFEAIDMPITSATEVRVYALVAQTDPATRAEIALPTAKWPFLRPEDGFCQAFYRATRYHRVGASLLIDSNRSRDELLPRHAR